MKTYGFLFWAYNVIWLGLAAYIVLLWMRLGSMRRKIEQLERRLGND